MRLSARTAAAVTLALGMVAALPAIANADDSGSVVVTRPGVVFHRSGAGDIRGRGFEKSIDSALEAGYSPCPICFAKEISAARGGSVALPGAAATAEVSITGQAIPAPPSSTVTQPFGIRYASSRFGGNSKEAIRNPYDLQIRAVPGREEQGAFGER